MLSHKILEAAPEILRQLHQAPMNLNEQVTAVILAGGRSSRMGGVDKGLMLLNERPMIEYVIDALRPQIGRLVINANRNEQMYESFGLPILSDRVADHQGPLAGILSALDNVETPYLLCVPCDTPMLPPDLFARLYKALVAQHAEISCVHDGEHLQPVFALLRQEVRDSLDEYFEAGGRAIHKWFAGRNLAQADFSDCPQCFININSPEELNQVQMDLRQPHLP